MAVRVKETEPVRVDREILKALSRGRTATLGEIKRVLTPVSPSFVGARVDALEASGVVKRTGDYATYQIASEDQA